MTGAGTGIGQGIARHFGELGARVLVHYGHHDEAIDARQLASEVGNDSFASFCDFTKPGEIQNLAEVVINKLCYVDLLVNNAGITLSKRLPEMTEGHIDTLFNVNVKAPLLLTKFLADVMQSNSLIINLSSVHAFAGKNGHSLYAATKGAIVAMTRALAMELASKRIRVNAIAPGWIETANQHKVMDFDRMAEGKKIPVGRLGFAYDIAELVAFLTTAGFINGQTIIADGGSIAALSHNGDWQKESDAPFGRPFVPGV